MNEYKSTLEELKTINHLFYGTSACCSSGMLKGPLLISYVVMTDGKIVWVRKSKIISFEEAFETAPEDIKHELIFHLDLFK